MIDLIYGCTTCKRERKWGSTSEKPAKYEIVEDPILLCEGRCDEATKHVFVRCDVRVFEGEVRKEEV